LVLQQSTEISSSYHSITYKLITASADSGQDHFLVMTRSRNVSLF
jgi:hypothetical protein